jgi:low affinity Fe/Cu permease
MNDLMKSQKDAVMFLEKNKVFISLKNVDLNKDEEDLLDIDYDILNMSEEDKENLDIDAIGEELGKKIIEVLEQSIENFEVKIDKDDK